MQAWTDYPFVEFGDTANAIAPVREVQIIAFDGDKYATVVVEGIELEIKAGYLYCKPGRHSKVQPVSLNALRKMQ